MRALITGASSGIGRAFAYRFAEDRTDLVITSRSHDTLEALAEDLCRRFGVQVEVVAADLGNHDAPAKIEAALGGRGIEISYLVNCAGFGTYGEFSSLPLAGELDEIQVNVVALTDMTHRFLQPMLKRKHGRILNVASTAAFQGGPLMATYCATKAYVVSFSEALAYELRGTGVTLTCLCPGPTESKFGERNGYKMPEMVAKKIPSAEEVARFGYEAMFAGKPVVVPGMLNWLATAGSRFAPRSFVTDITAKLLEAGRAG